MYLCIDKDGEGYVAKNRRLKEEVKKEKKTDYVNLLTRVNYQGQEEEKRWRCYMEFWRDIAIFCKEYEEGHVFKNRRD